MLPGAVRRHSALPFRGSNCLSALSLTLPPRQGSLYEMSHNPHNMCPISCVFTTVALNHLPLSAPLLHPTLNSSILFTLLTITVAARCLLPAALWGSLFVEGTSCRCLYLEVSNRLHMVTSQLSHYLNTATYPFLQCLCLPAEITTELHCYLQASSVVFS